VEILGLPQWTLNVRVEGNALEFSLGDGRRLVLRSRRPADLLDKGGQLMQAADLLGADLAEPLAQSAPRVLNVQFEPSLDDFDWEMLGIGTASLAERFALARQLVSAGEPPPFVDPVLAETLSVACVHGDVAPTHPQMRYLGIKHLSQAWVRKNISTAHVLVLDDVVLSDLIDGGGLPEHPCLLVMGWPQPMQHLTIALDHGAAVLGLEQGKDLDGTTLDALLFQLRSGASVGEAVRWLHRSASPARLAARLYGDAEIRFVRMQAPASRRQVTSLSFDLVGSTTLLQRLGDEAYSDMLVQLHARCTDAVRRHGGQPDDPQGDDGVMCYFGHPLAVEYAAVHAVEAGLEILGTVSALGVTVRVGIATGLVAIKANQPVGLSIHLAARLQQVTAPGTVLISEATRYLVDHAFDFKELEATPALKGIDVLEKYYLVLGPSRDAKLHRLERLPWLTPLVGRHEELARLHRCWGQVHVGESRLAVVRGDAGMGKSRLVREYRQQLMQAGVTVLECRCRADASASPYLTLAEALRSWLDIGADDATADALQKLAAVWPKESSGGEPVALIGALLGLAPQPAHSSPGSSRQRLLAVLVDWFNAFVRDRPCCLIVEDWHWVDPSTREFFKHLMNARGGPGLLLVLTTRGETASAPLALERFAHIELAGVTPEAARELVRLVCGDAPLPAGLVRMLAERGDGVPLFLEEATRIALEQSNEGSGAEVATLEAVPASLQDLLMARLDGLGACKLVAQVAAVLGREFSLPILTALHESGGFALGAATVGERLAALVHSGLVQSQGGGQFAFKHALVRDVAYASLWASDRQALHARVVMLFQERWPALVASRPELLAQHQTDAGQYSDALAQWELAASNAAARSAEVEAVSHLRRALGVLARIEPFAERDRTALRLQLLLAARLIVTEGYGAQAVLEAYLEAQRLCDRIGDEGARFKVEMGLEAYRFMRADFSLALEHGRRAAAIAVRSNDVKQVLQAHWGLACTLFHQGELRAAMREMEAGLTLYTPAMHQLFGVQNPGVMCMAYSSWGLWELGKPDSALARINHAVGISEEVGHKFSQAVALAYGASIELLRGETDAALTRSDACIRVCEDSGFPVWLAIARCMRGRLLCERGEFAYGLSEIRAGFALWLSTGAMVSRPLYLVLQTEGLMLAGEVAAAQACVEEGLAISSRTGERQLEAELRRLRGELALQRHNASEAETWFKSAYAIAIRQHRLGFALRSATSLARLWAADGREARARRLLVPLVARWREGRATRDVRTALALCESLQ
jgi:class 3 adenylate cyclase/predicted ATPase